AGAYRNLQYLSDKLRWDKDIEEVDKLVLADPQTSGGLLMAVPGDKAETVAAALRAAGINGNIIGEVTASAEPLIYVERS
ncbi:MAG: Selenide, water dikinase, partial [Pelotomaculum thermopropionicum]